MINHVHCEHDVEACVLEWQAIGIGHSAAIRLPFFERSHACKRFLNNAGRQPPPPYFRTKALRAANFELSRY